MRIFLNFYDALPRILVEVEVDLIKSISPAVASTSIISVGPTKIQSQGRHDICHFSGLENFTLKST